MTALTPGTGAPMRMLLTRWQLPALLLVLRLKR